jgi:hypothetical protein
MRKVIETMTIKREIAIKVRDPDQEIINLIAVKIEDIKARINKEDTNQERRPIKPLNLAGASEANGLI